MQHHELAVAGSLFIEPCEFSCLSHPLESPDSTVAESLAKCERGFVSDLPKLQFHRPTAPECAAVCMCEPSPEPVPARLVFDSHFHLDPLQWSLNLPQDISLQQMMAAVGRISEDYQVDLAGCIAVFCDIPFYPSPKRMDALSSYSVSVAIGVHPNATTLTEEEKMKFRATFNHPNVTCSSCHCYTKRSR